MVNISIQKLKFWKSPQPFRAVSLVRDDLRRLGGTFKHKNRTSDDFNKYVEWITPLGLYVMQPYTKTVGKATLEGLLAEKVIIYRL